MKRIFLTLLALSFFGLAHAQKFKFGPKAGVTAASITGRNAPAEIDRKIKIGAVIGGVAEIKFNDKFSLQPELLASLQGERYDYRFEWEEGYEDHQDNLDLIYIQIPVMARYYFVKGLNVSAGPQLGVLVSAKVRAESQSSDFLVETSQSKTFDVKDDYKTIDFGANFGLGYDFSNGIFVDARYTLGLLNISEFGGPGSIKNSVVAVSGGFKF